MSYIDTEIVCPPLTETERLRVATIKAEDRARVAPESARIRETYVNGRMTQFVTRTGMTLPAARKVIEQQCNGVLAPDIELPFDDSMLAGCTVRDVVADPSRFVEKTLADPIEGVEYGRCKAKVLRRDDGSLFINSFAHGGTTYVLRDSENMFAGVAAVTNLDVGAITEHSRTATQVECWKPILECFLTNYATLPSPAGSVPQLPTEAQGSVHPLFDVIRPCIDKIVSYAEGTRSKFKTAQVYEVLAVLQNIHLTTYDAVLRHLVGMGCTVNTRRINLCAAGFVNDVEAKVCPVNNWLRDVQGHIEPCNSDNVSIFLEVLGMEIRWNAWFKRVEVRGFRWPEWEKMNDTVVSVLRTRATSKEIGFQVSKEFLRDVLHAIAHDNPVDPVLDFLNDLQMKWDGQPRLDDWLSNVCHVEANAYHRAVARNVIGGMVRRARYPGVKHDEAMLLIGPEDTLKSTLCRVLACRDEWFSDSVTFEGSPQNAVPQLFGKWVIELSELDVSRRDFQTVKRFLSTVSDNVTLKYEAFSSDHPRRCIFIATSNPEKPLLDDTGNRRFLPVVSCGLIDVDWLRVNIHQIIGECAAREAAGESFLIPRDVVPDARARQEAARTESPAEVLLRDWFAEQPEGVFITPADLLHALTIAKQQVSYKSVAPAMRQLGFRPYNGRAEEKGPMMRTWIKSKHNDLRACSRLAPSQIMNCPVKWGIKSEPPSNGADADVRAGGPPPSLPPFPSRH